MTAAESIRKLVSGTGIPLPGDDIDTDRIIPARYLREITFETLGQYAFYDERYDEKGNKKDHPLNDPRFTGGTILIVNRNFGCGSSREHAPQALMRMGVSAFIGESFGEIFSGNCTVLGLPAVRIAHEAVKALMARIQADPAVRIEIDLEHSILKSASDEFAFTMPVTDQRSLVTGYWDTLSVLMSNEKEIRAASQRLPYTNGFSK